MNRRADLGDRILLLGTEKGIEPPLSVVKERQPHWEVLGCKDCFRECEHFDDCKSELERRQMKQRKRTKFAFAEPEDENRKIVSMLEFQGSVYVATQKGVYIVKGDTLVRLKLVDKTNEP